MSKYSTAFARKVYLPSLETRIKDWTIAVNCWRGEKALHHLDRPVKIFTSLKEYRGDVRSDSLHVESLALKRKKMPFAAPAIAN